MSFHTVFSQLAQYDDHVTLSAGAFMNRHIVFHSQLSTLLLAILHCNVAWNSGRIF